jgi:hypothetical protein
MGTASHRHRPAALTSITHSMRSCALVALASFAAAKSILPTVEGHTDGWVVNQTQTQRCTVRLVRRTSKSVACFPEGDARGGGRYGCLDNGTMFTRWKCAGLFQCGNGALTMCGTQAANYKECACKEPCHTSGYTSACPPGLPARPYPPPLPPVPPMPPPPLAPGSESAPQLHAVQQTASCASWCDKGGRPLEHEHWCKCAACTNVTGADRPPLAEGAPCVHGHALRAPPPPVSWSVSFVNSFVASIVQG